MSCFDKEIYDYTQVANLMRSHGMDFATIEKCLDFIRAEARAEALREAADRAEEYIKTTLWRDIEYDRENYDIEFDELRAAITQDSKPCD
jgi:hypothetical protein